MHKKSYRSVKSFHGDPYETDEFRPQIDIGVTLTIPGDEAHEKDVKDLERIIKDALVTAFPPGVIIKRINVTSY